MNWRWTNYNLLQFCFRYFPQVVTLMEIPQGTPWKTAENRTLKAGSSPPPSRVMRRKLFIINNLYGLIKMLGRLS
jgi:hypothetical protein